ncbi:MAG: hypothetical protein RTU09_06150 [Candidatus Thorarchaeota archaeon]
MRSKFNKHILRVKRAGSDKFNDFPDVIKLDDQKMNPGNKGSP